MEPPRTPGGTISRSCRDPVHKLFRRRRCCRTSASAPDGRHQGSFSATGQDLHVTTAPKHLATTTSGANEGYVQLLYTRGWLKETGGRVPDSNGLKKSSTATHRNHVGSASPANSVLSPVLIFKSGPGQGQFRDGDEAKAAALSPGPEGSKVSSGYISG